MATRRPTDREICAAAKLHEAAAAILAELEDRYDGAPDSNNLWMGEHIERLTRACNAAGPLLMITEAVQEEKQPC